MTVVLYRNTFTPFRGDVESNFLFMDKNVYLYRITANIIKEEVSKRMTCIFPWSQFLEYVWDPLGWSVVLRNNHLIFKIAMRDKSNKIFGALLNKFQFSTMLCWTCWAEYGTKQHAQHMAIVHQYPRKFHSILANTNLSQFPTEKNNS